MVWFSWFIGGSCGGEEINEDVSTGVGGLNA